MASMPATSRSACEVATMSFMRWIFGMNARGLLLSAETTANDAHHINAPAGATQRTATRCARKRRLAAVTISCLVAAGGTLSAISAEPSTPSAPVAWNVFLGPWQVIGPFPKPEPEVGSGLRTSYLQSETDAEPSGRIDYQGGHYTWRPYSGRVLDFQRAFESTNDLEEVVAYAWTS